MTQEEAITVALDRLGPRAWVAAEKEEHPRGCPFKIYMAGVIDFDDEGPVQAVFFCERSWAKLVERMKDEDGNCARARARGEAAKERIKIENNN